MHSNVRAAVELSVDLLHHHWNLLLDTLETHCGNSWNVREGGGVVKWWRGEVVTWWRGGVMKRWRGGVVKWWRGGVVKWWRGEEVA